MKYQEKYTLGQKSLVKHRLALRSFIMSNFAAQILNMIKIHKDINSQLLCDTIVEGMQENKAKKITVLDLRHVKGAVTDFFVICSGESSTQVEGIAESVRRFTSKALKEKPWHVEGKGNAEWVLLDYVNVVAHIFYREIRDYYDLEDLWADAKRTDVPDAL